MKSIIPFIIIQILSYLNLLAQIPEIKLNEPLRIDFQLYNGSGFAPGSDGGRLDSRFWRVTGLSDGTMDFGGTYLGGDYGRGISPGKVSSGGVYAFQVNPTKRILGFQPTGTDLVPGALTLKMKMASLDSIKAIAINYVAYFMNDQNRSTAVRLEWSQDDKNYTTIDSLSFATPIANVSDPTWQSDTLFGSLSAQTLAKSEDLYLRWVMNDAGGTGSRDEWGVADLLVEFIPFEKDEDGEDDDQGGNDEDDDENDDGNEDDDEDDENDDPEEITAPEIPASEVKLNARTDSTIAIRWNNGSGTARLVLLKPDITSECQPTDSTSYRSNLNPAFADTTKGSCAVVFNGSGDSVQIEGLDTDQEIHVIVFEYNGEQGNERYLTTKAAQASFRTRSSQPSALQSLKLVHISDLNLVLSWDTPNTADIRIVLSDKAPVGNQLLSFEDDAYQVFDSTGLTLVCIQTSPCILERSILGDKGIYAWNVSGAPGHKSAQKEAPLYIKPEWPDADQGMILTKWLFDYDTDEKTQVIWDFEDANLNIVGARDRGYAAGSVGRARNADQWDQSNGTKAWMFSMTSWGLKEMSLSFKLLSSNTGPAEFQLRCSTRDVEITDPRVLKAGTAWNTAIFHKLELPKECLGHANIQIHIAAMGNLALNGNPVSRAGTSRIDEITIWGKRSDEPGLLLAQPKVIHIRDDSTQVSTHWISAAAEYPNRRYLRLWSQYEEREIEMKPHGPKMQSLTYLNKNPDTEYKAMLCAWTITSKSCSEALEYRTALPVPSPPTWTTITPTHPDTLLIEQTHNPSDTWVYLSKNHLPEPQFVDSVGLKSTLHTDATFHRRYSSHQRIVIGGLQPGAEYHLWLVSVVGPDSTMRFSRAPHPYQKVTMPKLLAPEPPVVQVRMVQRGTDLIRLVVEAVPDTKLLWTLTPSDLPESVPLDDEDYSANQSYSQCAQIPNGLCVIAKEYSKDLIIRHLPLSRSWILRGYAYQELNGAISYNKQAVVEYQFESLKDPRELAVRVPEITQRQSKEAFGLVGTVAWIDQSRFIILGDGGNALLSYAKPGPDKGDSIAAYVQFKDAGYSVEYVLNLGASKNAEAKPYHVDPRIKHSDLRTKTQLGLGNMLMSSSSCSITGHLFSQRGLARRPVCVLNYTAADPSSLKATEYGLRGIPLWSDRDTLQLWLLSPDDATPYLPGQVLTALPNTGQLLTWREGSSEKISFSWVRCAAQRPYDVWPDSTEWRTYFGTRRAGAGNPFVLREQVDKLGIEVPAGELHRLHLGEDSLASQLDIEWTIWNQEGRLSEAREDDLLWQPFQLLRVQTTHLTDSEVLPEYFDVSEAWPNPFNPSTNLRLFIPSTDEVKVEAYDILGRKIATIVSTNLSSGVHDIIWNAQGFSSGVYVLLIQYQGKKLIRIMTLSK